MDPDPQNVLMFLLQLTAYVVMYLKKDDPKILTLYAASAGFLLAVILLYRILYPKVSKLIVNNMCMLLCIGMIMLTRLEEENAIKQLIFAAVGVVIGLVVPVVIRKLDRLKDWGYMYAGAGILALVLVAVLAGGFRWSKAWIYDRRIRNTAVRVCENFICIFCSGKFKPFFGV